MKIQIASDLHLEWFGLKHPGFSTLAPAADADMLILAGDIHTGTRALSAFKEWPVPVLYVAGNHEFYGHCYETALSHLNAEPLPGSVCFLDKRVWIKEGVRFLGATLWTDYNLYGNPQEARQAAARAMADHLHIEGRPGFVFSTEDALEEHRATRAWLQRELAQPFEGKTVVITHHGCHPDGVSPRFQGHYLTPAFYSDLRDLMPQVDLWVHGHTHDSVDLQEGRCRIVANPRGYPLNIRSAQSLEDLVFENRQFDAAKVVSL